MSLSTLFVPLMAYVQGLDRQPSPQASLVDDELQRLIKQARDQAVIREIDLRTFHDALFPVVAWIDERLSLLPSWRETRPWRGHMLQRSLFGTSVAGVQFFERLEALAPDDSALREVYVTCLALGFVGRFSQNPNSPELNALLQAQYRLLRPEMTLGTRHPVARLFPEAYRLIVEAGSRRSWRLGSPLFWLLVAVLPVALLAGLALWFDSLLGVQVADITRRLP